MKKLLVSGFLLMTACAAPEFNTDPLQHKLVTGRLADWDVEYNEHTARVSYADNQPLVRVGRGETNSEWLADQVQAAETASGCSVIPNTVQRSFGTYIVSIDCTKRP